MEHVAINAKATYPDAFNYLCIVFLNAPEETSSSISNTFCHFCAQLTNFVPVTANNYNENAVVRYASTIIREHSTIQTFAQLRPSVDSLGF